MTIANPKSWYLSAASRSFVQEDGSPFLNDAATPRVVAYSHEPVQIVLLDLTIPEDANLFLVRINNQFGVDGDGNWYAPLAESQQAEKVDESTIAFWLDSNLDSVQDRLGDADAIGCFLQLTFAKSDGDPTPDDVLMQIVVPIEYANATPVNALPPTPPASGSWADQAFVAAAMSSHNQSEAAHPYILGLIESAGVGLSLATTAPAALASQAAVGTGTTAARDDHQHVLPSAADVGAAASNHNHDSVYSGISHTHTGFVATSAVGTAGGVCDLNESGLVPASRLPSYVDDVVEAANYAALPATGEAGKIYIALDTGYQYRWGGSSYVELPRGGVALGETSETAYRGDRGKTAYDHSQAAGNPHGLTLAGLGAAAVAHTHSEYVSGPASSTDNALIRFDGTTGKISQNSNVIIDDLGNISISGTDTSGIDGLLMNPSAKTSGYFLRAQIAGGSDKFSVSYNGAIVCASSLTAAAITVSGTIIKTSSTSSTLTINPFNGANSSAASSGLDAVQIGDGTAYNARTGGTNKWLSVQAKYNQASGTADNWDLFVNRTETAIGSGSQYSQGWAVGGTVHSSLTKLGLLTLGVGVDKQIDQRTGTGRKLWTGTQAQYDALGTYPADTDYLIHEA